MGGNCMGVRLYKNDSKAILDSLLNRSKCVIKLDQLIIKDDFNNEMLITDSTHIKQATVYYF